MDYAKIEEDLRDWPVLNAYAARGAEAIKKLLQRVKELEDDVTALTKALQVGSRKELQDEGKHPSPCQKFCEATAFYIAERNLKRYNEQLNKRNNELVSALKDALDTIEWMNGCTEPSQDCIEEAISDINKALKGE